MKKQHELSLASFIDGYVRSGDCPSALAQKIDSTSPVLVALGLLDDFTTRRRSDNTALQAARKVVVEDVPETDVLVLFFSYWAAATLIKGRLDESVSLVHQARAFTTDQTPPEVISFTDLAEARLCAAKGNRHKQKDLITLALERLDKSSPRRALALLELSSLLAQMGQLKKDVESELTRRIHSAHSSELNSHVTAIRFINSVEAGRTEQALQLMADLDGATIPAEIAGDLDKYKLILSFMQWTSASTNGGNHSSPADQPDWALAITCLLTSRSHQALRWARLRERHARDSIIGNDFVAFNLIRTELSEGNVAAATRIVDMRKQHGNSNFLDDFFLARAAAIDGHDDRAAEHFARVLAIVDSCGMAGRLRFELRLSPELQIDTLFHMIHSSRPITPEKSAPATPAPARPTSDDPPRIATIIGSSSATATLRETILRFAPSDIPVLITGETGTGKELVARAIHTTGPRAGEPFVAINCGAIAESLLESELFGHEKGAFSGAGAAHKGLFEEAGKGTILLDEIGDISPRLQIVLLRVLETGEIRPVGSAKPRLLTCRVLMSTNANLDERARDNSFRKDLLYRLRRLEIHLHPLRERAQDILPLAAHFFDIGRSDGIHAMMSQRLIETLMTHSWPGNVRELRNTVERMRLMNSDKLYYDHQDLDVRIGSTQATTPQELTAPALNADISEPLISPNLEDPSVLQQDHERTDLSIRKGTSRVRRLALLRDLFRQHQLLTRGEIIDTLRISPNTATKDLKELRDEGFIRKMQPTSSPRSAYFVLDGEQSSQVRSSRLSGS